MHLLLTGMLMSPVALILILILALLIFGKRLPEVARSLGKGIVEFKKGLKGIEDEVDGSVARSEAQAETPRPPQKITTPAPKFDTEPTDSQGKPRYS